ncbi:MAG: hypothetical protein LBN34_08045 [Clostridiales Family XIII bacterium]|jgi:hypothetical protein|nr:hypothetical protein [Clostridiales Family XIII bacterium]
MRNDGKNEIIVGVVLIVICYLAFLSIDIANIGTWKGLGLGEGWSPILKLTSIVFCLFLVRFAKSSPSNIRDANLQFIVFIWTIVADYFLLFTYFFAIGILIFCGAHLTAILRYRKKLFLPSLIFFFISWILFALLKFAGVEISVFYFAAAIYTILIITVAITGFCSDQPKINRRLSSVGMILFLLCDVNVAAFNLLPQESFIGNMASVLMWAFYLPAQTLLALSTYKCCYCASLKAVKAAITKSFSSLK